MRPDDRVAEGPPHEPVRSPRGAGPAGRVVAALRTHAVFAVLVGLGVVLRVLTVLAYRPALLFDDSAAYLNVADAPLAPGGDRPIGYAVGLLRPLLVVGDLGLVAIVQHMFGLVTALVLYRVLVRLGSRRWLAALGTAPVLLDAYVLQIEQMIMPEALFHLLLASGLAVLVVWGRGGWPAPADDAAPSAATAAAGGLLFAAAALVRVVGLILVVPLALYGLLAVPRWRERLIVTGIAVACFCVPLAGYAAWYDAVHGQFRVSGQSDETWYGRVAPFVDCSRLDLPPHARPLCPQLPPGERPGPGMYVHGARSPLADYEPPAGMSRGEVLRDFAREAILSQPFDYAGAVVSDFLWVFSWSKVDKPDSSAPVARWQFTLAYPDFLPDAAEYIARYGDTGPAVHEDLAGFLRGYQLSVGFTRGPVLLAAVLAGLVAAVGVTRTGHTRSPRLQAACLLWTLVPLTLLFVPAALFEFSWRYQLPGIVLLPAAGVLGVTAILGPRAAARADDGSPSPGVSAR